MSTGCKNILCSLIFIGLLIYPISHAHTADKEIPKAGQPLISPDEMMVHLEEVLASERNEHADLKKQLKALEADQAALRSEIEIYNFQNTVQDQLLLATQPQIEDLEDAIDVNLREGRALNKRVDRFQKQWDKTSVVVRQTADRIDLAQEDLVEELGLDVAVGRLFCLGRMGCLGVADGRAAKALLCPSHTSRPILLSDRTRHPQIH